MEGSPAGGAPPPPPRIPQPPEDLRPAAAGDLKELRRWTIVAGVWAVAATALAVLALIRPGQQDVADRSAAAAKRSVDRMQDRFDSRLRRLAKRIDRVPRAAELQYLGNRVRQVEDRSGQTAGDAKAARDSIGELQDRLERVARAQQQQSRPAREDNPRRRSSGGRPRN